LKGCHRKSRVEAEDATDMDKPLNTPDMVLANLRGAPERMRQIDQMLGDELPRQFAEAVSALLYHIEEKPGKLNSLVPNRDVGAEVCMSIMNAATESETGWNTLRLGNVPAMQRHGRVATELIALAVLHALPIEILREVDGGGPLVRYLRDHPDASVATAVKPIRERIGDQGGVVRTPLKATEVFSSFMKIAEQLDILSGDSLDRFRKYRKTIQHAASHATWAISLYHFEGFFKGSGGSRAGAMFSPERQATYREAGEEIVGVTRFNIELLESTHKFITAKAREKTDEP